MSRKLYLALLCIAAVVSLATLSMAAHPEAGSQAPSFTLKSQDGTPVKLEDFRGKWVVLYFYPKDFTSGCTLEAHKFERDLAECQNLSAIILGVRAHTAQS